jgi:hypothetical protein
MHIWKLGERIKDTSRRRTNSRCAAKCHAAMVTGLLLTARESFNIPIIDCVSSPAINVATGTAVRVLPTHDTEGVS